MIKTKQKRAGGSTKRCDNVIDGAEEEPAGWTAAAGLISAPGTALQAVAPAGLGCFAAAFGGFRRRARSLCGLALRRTGCAAFLGALPARLHQRDPPDDFRPSGRAPLLGVTALGGDLVAARERAYTAIARIDWPEGFCRRDIGLRRAG